MGHDIYLDGPGTLFFPRHLSPATSEKTLNIKISSGNTADETHAVKINRKYHVRFLHF